MSSKKKIHFISYFYPPVKAVGTLRNYYISHLFEENGYDVTVYGGKPIGYLHKDNMDISSKIKLKRTIAFDYHIFDFYIKKQRSKNKKKGNTTGPSFKSYFPFNILIGEGGFFYIIITLLRLVWNIKNVDILWTSYSPYSDHFIASILKMLKPSIFWISDWRDVDIDVDWPENKITLVQKKINYFFFKRVDLVVSVSQGYLKFVKKYSSQSYLLRNGIKDRYSFNPKVVDTSAFSITYVGALYGGRRDPSPIFNAIQKLAKEGKIDLNKVSLRYAGSEGELFKALANKYGLRNCVVDYGMVTFAESQKLQRSSQINLMLSWSSEKMNTFPAKFYEYINSQRPLLLIIDGKSDIEFDDIFEKTNVGFLIYNDKNIIENLMLRLNDWYTEWETSKILEVDHIKTETKTFYWDTSFSIFLNFLSRK